MPRSPMRWRSSFSSAPIGTRFCGARGSTCGWEATRRQQRGGAIGDRDGVLLGELSRCLTPNDAGPGMPAVEHRETHVPGVPLVVGDAEQRRALTGRELGDDRVVIGFQVGDAVALHVADRGVGGEVVERPVGDHEALGGERGGGFAFSAAHLGVQLHHETAGILGRAGGGVDPGFQRDGRHLLLAAAGQHRPPFDPNRGDLGATGGAVPSGGAHGERPHEPGVGPAIGSSSVSRASTRRTPSTNATCSTPSSMPSRGSQSSVSTVGSTDPSAGARASSWSSGVPYSGSQPSTKMRAMARIVPGHPDTSGSRVSA